MPSYTLDQLDDLEMATEDSSPADQRAALAYVAGLLEQHSITYGVTGGINFYLRGSGRTTEDIDIVVDNAPRMDAILDIFNTSSKSVQLFQIPCFRRSISLKLSFIFL